MSCISKCMEFSPIHSFMNIWLNFTAVDIVSARLDHNVFHSGKYLLKYFLFEDKMYGFTSNSIFHHEDRTTN